MKRGLRILLALLPLAILEIALRALGIGQSLLYEENSAYGYRPAPSQKFSTFGHPVTILPSGYRGPVEKSDTLFVGDSVVYGTAVLRDEETIPARLGGVNGGVNGWGPQNIAAYLRQADLSGFKRVVWILPTCDVLRPFMKLRGGLISTNRRMALRLEYLLRFVWYGKLAAQPSPSDPAEFEDNVAAVLETAEQLKGRGLELLMVWLPSREEASGQVTAETPFYHQLRQRVAAAGIPSVELKPSGDLQRIYRDTAHLTAEGCRWAAEEIRPHLQPHDPSAGS